MPVQNREYDINLCSPPQEPPLHASPSSIPKMRVWPIWGHEKNLESTSQRWCVFSTFFINLALYLQKVLKQLFPKFCTLTLLPIRSSYCVIVRVRVVLKRTVAGDWRFDVLTLKMTSAQIVETSVTNNSSFQNYPHPDDHPIQTIDTPGFKPFTV